MIPQTSNVTNLQLGFCLSATKAGEYAMFHSLNNYLKKSNKSN